MPPAPDSDMEYRAEQHVAKLGVHATVAQW